MTENPLMNFLIKKASPMDNSFGTDILDRLRYYNVLSDLRLRNKISETDAVNILNNEVNPAIWNNKAINDLVYKYSGKPNAIDIEKLWKAYNMQNNNALGEVSPIYRGALQSANLSPTSIDPYDAAIDIFNYANNAPNTLNYMDELPETQFDTPINLQASTPRKLMSSSHSGPTINIADFNKPYSHEEAQAILAKGLNGGSTSITISPDDFNKIYSPEEAQAVIAQGINGDATATTPSSETVAKPAPVVPASAPETAATTTAPATTTTTTTSPEPVATTPGSTNTPAPTPAPEPVQPASVPVAANAQAVQNPFYNPRDITRQQMRQYRHYTGANDMKSDMDRWKTYQAMNGNRNASNADYYTAKRTNTLDKVVNPVTAQSK